MLDTKIDEVVIKKEFENEINLIKLLLEDAIKDSKTEGLNRSYYEGKYVAYDYVLSELNSLYSRITTAIGIIKKYKD